jgi:hypothetical protein
MATGSLDTNGVWNYGEDDNIALFSDLLNLGTTSTSDAFTSDRARLSTVESNLEATSTFVAASQTARDSHWGIPADTTAELLLQNLGARTVRTDTGYTEQFFATYNAASNPGGRTPSAWYPVPKSSGLVPMLPTSATFVTGSGSVDDLGRTSFTSVTNFSISGAFTNDFSNYLLQLDGVLSGANANLTFQFTFGSNLAASPYYSWAGLKANRSSLSVNSGVAQTSANFGNASLKGGAGYLIIMNPKNGSLNTTFTTRFGGVDNAENYYSDTSGVYLEGRPMDGIKLSVSGGTFTGNVQVFGYNG